MKSVFLVLLLSISSGWCYRHIKAKATSETQAEAVKKLIFRILPDRADYFLVDVNPNLGIDGKDTFKLEKIENGSIKISGTTGVTVATGFNYYLKYYLNAQITWQTSQLNIPKTLPNVNVTIKLNDRLRYYQNVCTTSYSFVWWDWTSWEKHIDWMALNSFNFILAFTGQEAIWERVYKKFNLDDNAINEHFTGPAFLSWLRMGNIRGWGGGLSSAWHKRTLALQKQIITRMRSLGIITILPAFAGHLPRAFKHLYPNAKMDIIDPWNHFNDTYCCPYFLDPTEELFQQIGQAFIKEQISEFGTDHVYNCDSFNENTPTSSDLMYLSNVSKAIYKAMASVDPQAIWVLQGWLFYADDYWEDLDKVQSFLTSVDSGKMIVLDLQSEQFPQYDRLHNYFGQPYIWCMLHNFGGTLGMFGSSTIVNSKPYNARNEKNSTMIGIGLTMEGINQNYVVYDLMIETAWRTGSVDLEDWFKNYTIRRYGVKDANAIAAWKILQKTVYDFKELIKIRGRYSITNTPSLHLVTWTWYEFEDLLNAWSLLLKVESQSEGYMYDVVDVTRQVLQCWGDKIYPKLIKAYTLKDQKSFNEKSIKFLEIFDDMEEILASNKNFLLGNWLEAARSASNDDQEKDLFEYNARNQITLWGPKGEIMNYAIKQWSGVVSKFLKPRWNLFLNYAKSALAGEVTFNQTFIKKKMFVEVEKPFTIDKTTFPTDPKGDSLEIAKKIYNKWINYTIY